MARIAMPVADGFEDSECEVPYQRLRDAGHEVVMLGPKLGEVVEGKRGRTRISIQATPAELDVDAVLTSWPSIRKDLENAGARWIDQDLVEDANLITSRKPEDLEVFCKAILGRLAQEQEGVKP